MSSVLWVLLLFAASIILVQWWMGRRSLSEIAEMKAAVSDGGVLVDVRTPTEFASGHARGAINVPLDELSRSVERIGDREQPVVVCCRSGARSRAATTVLRNAGYRQVLDLGRWTNWRRRIHDSNTSLRAE